MSAADLLLTVRGQDDRWLSMAPDRTYFEAKYQPRVNRSRETYEIPFDNQDATFGTTGRCTVPVKGDYLTRLTLRTVMPPIYPTVEGQYVYPTPSSQVGGTVYVNKTLDLVVADGVTLTANTVGNHYFSIGAQVTLAGTAYVIFDLDGTYTITGIPTANSFTCSTVLAGISYNGTVSSPGIQCGDIISYFSTANSNLWVNNVTNKTWQITGGSITGTTGTFTTSEPSNFPVGSQVVLNLPETGIVSKIFTITSSSDASFSCTNFEGTFVMVGQTAQAYSNDKGQTWTTVKNTIGGSYFGVGEGISNFVMVGYQYGSVKQAYSILNGTVWIPVASPLYGTWRSVAYGNGVYVIVGDDGVQGRSTDNGQTWTYATTMLSDIWYNVAYGNGVFVMVGNSGQARSTDYGVTWTYVSGYVGYDVAYGNGVFVMVGPSITGKYSTDYGITWTASSGFSSYYSITYGNGVFVVTNGGAQGRSTDYGVSFTNSSFLSNYWTDIAYGGGVFVITAYNGGQIISTDDGQTWTFIDSPSVGPYNSIAFSPAIYTQSPSDSVSLVVPPLQLTDRVFSSNVYPSISFADASDAAFWGFDSREGLTYALPATPPWTYTQSGWISGFLPPSTSTYDDSVAHKLCKDVRILVGKQTIKEYSGEYIELQNDLLVPYENKAILKLMNGTLDQTQATVAREYYVNLPLGTKEIPLCALTHQNMSVEVDFESYLNVSQNLNAGTGDFLDAKSYTTYDASTGILGGQPVDVQTTFSYQQYIFIVTYGGQFIIFDTTKNVDDPASYIVLSAFSGSSLFSQFCVLSGNLYIGLTNGQLARMIISELIQGNISSFVVNNYTPTIGSLTGTIIADFRYVYYTVSNTATSNVFVSKYDTTGVFTNPSSYTTVDFTKTFNSSVTGVYQTLSTGTELIMIPQGTTGTLYTYQLNANVQSQWYSLDYSAYGSSITEGVLVGNSIYFATEQYFSILKYSNSTFDVYPKYSIVMVGNTTQAYTEGNGFSWTSVSNPLIGRWYSAVYGNDVFVMTGDAGQAYSINNGLSWTTAPSGIGGDWRGVAYGNGIFVITGNTTGQAYSVDNGRTWTASTTSLPGYWRSITYGDGVFVMVGEPSLQAYSIDNGENWVSVTSPLFGYWYGVTYGNGVFVAVAGSGEVARSVDHGETWTYGSPAYYPSVWFNVAYGNGVFVCSGGLTAYSIDNGQTFHTSDTYVTQPWLAMGYGNSSIFLIGAGASYGGTNRQAVSIDNGKNFTYSTFSLPGWWENFATKPPEFSIPNTGFKNLMTTGNYIYCALGNVAVQIDTTKDLSTAAAYKFPAPLPVNQYVFANGPRYVYMFAQGDNTATNIVEFDPYGPDTTFKASILVDYESLPLGVPKPDKALLGLVQTQKVTDMNYMNIKGPVKELWVTGASDSANVFQYSNLATRSTLELTGEQIITNDVGTRTFLNTIEPFETHTSMPIRNFSVIPFEFDPESEIPNGTINFSRIRDQVLSANAQTVWVSNYNLLAIQGGIGGLIFNS